MSIVYQNYNDPIYKDILWSKPDNKAHAGKLLIIGGNQGSVFAPIKSYEHAINAGAGEVKIIMPDSTKKILGPMIHSIPIIFVNSTPSGSLSLKSQTEIKAYIDWSDAVLLAGDFSKNSETQILINKLASNISKFTVLADDAVEVFYLDSTHLNNRNILLVTNFNQLQKITSSVKSAIHFTSTMDGQIISKNLIELSETLKCYMLLIDKDHAYSVYDNTLISTKGLPEDKDLLSHASTESVVWAMQLPQNKLEAIATSLTQI